MKMFNFMEQLRSAQQLASAFEAGRKPPARALEKLGLSKEMGERFKR